MKKCASVLVLLALVLMTAPVMADELPAALQAIGAGDSVVSQADADAVRGTFLIQLKSFDITGGVAVGSTTLMEGIIGEFEYTSVSGNSVLTAKGTFGGLSGGIGIGADGSLVTAWEGKALMEQFDFSGNFEQSFKQAYSPNGMPSLDW